MNRTLKLRDFSREEQKRFNEIDLYLKLNHVFRVLGNTSITYALFEVLCSAANLNISIIKSIIVGMQTTGSVLIPHQTELIIMLYRHGVSVAKITKLTGKSAPTIYEHLNQYITEDQPELLPKLKDELQPQLRGFIEKLRELLAYDEY